MNGFASETAIHGWFEDKPYEEYAQILTNNINTLAKILAKELCNGK